MTPQPPSVLSDELQEQIRQLAHGRTCTDADILMCSDIDGTWCPSCERFRQQLTDLVTQAIASAAPRWQSDGTNKEGHAASCRCDACVLLLTDGRLRKCILSRLALHSAIPDTGDAERRAERCIARGLLDYQEGEWMPLAPLPAEDRT